MKFLLLLFFILVLNLSAISQVRWGVFAGPQITTVQYTIRDTKQNSNMKYGFHAGMSLKVPFDVNLFFTPAISYSLKGYKVKFNQSSFPPDSFAISNNVTLHTLEIAPMLQYDFNDRPNHFFIKAGPSLDVQLFGHEKFYLPDGTLKSRNMKFSFGDYGHFADNILAQFGYERRNSFIIFIQYTYGLGNINNADGGPKIYHRVISFSMGKYFNRKK